MPRPGETPKNTNGTTFTDPVSRWMKQWKEKQQQLEEEAVRRIANEIEGNAQDIIGELGSVDFLNSRLPAHILNETAEGYPTMSRLEYETEALIQLLDKDPQHINMDIRSIDKKLLALALMFKQSVAHGDAMAAQMAKDALYVGIHDIRCKLPTHQTDLADAFVQENTEYLDNWLTLVGFAQSYDHVKNSLAIQNAATKDAEQRQKDKVESICDQIDENEAFAQAFFFILDHDTPENRADWDDIQRKAHKLLIDAKMEDFNIMLHRRQSMAFENDLSSIKQKMDSLRTSLNRLPNVSDPNLMNKYKDSMQDFVKNIAASDARMAETLTTVDELSGALQQLDVSSGSVLKNEAAQAQAAILLKRMMTLQEIQSGQSTVNHMRNLREHNWLTKAEREALRIQNEQKLAQENEQAIQNSQTQRQRQAN